MEELHLHLHRSHEADRKKPRHSQQVRETYQSRLFYKGACNREIAIHSITY